MTPSFWTEDRTATLAEMWDRGRPVRDIAEALVTTCNAVISKASRLMLDYHPNAERTNPHLRSA